MKEALFKATIAPAMWLGLDKKGRLQEGCDADITIFNPDTIIDRAKPEIGQLTLPPEGIYYVIVNGEIVVEGGGLTGKTSGKLIRRTWEIPGGTLESDETYLDTIARELMEEAFILDRINAGYNPEKIPIANTITP